jgi:hypothetical protein
MKISENPDFAGAPWKALKTTFTYKFQTGGNKILFAKIANANGLESSPFSDSITVASQEPLPVVSVSSLNCRDASLLLNISTINGAAPISQMMVSSTGNMTGQNWENYSTTKSIARAHLSGPILVRLKDTFGREKQSQLNEIQCLNTLSEARDSLSTTSVGTKALFAGGYKYNDQGSGIASSIVDIFDSVTGIWTTANLSQARGGLAATRLDTKAFFAGGAGTGGVSNVVDVFDEATGIWSTESLSQGRYGLVASSVGTKALFAGGNISGTDSTVVDIFDSVSGVWSTANLSEARRALSVTTVGTKAIFAGGNYQSNVVDIFDAATGTWSTATLSQGRGRLSAASAGSKAMFAGGSRDITGPSSNVVDIFDAVTGIWSSSTLSLARWSLSAIGVGTKAFFAGGGSTDLGASAVVDIYDSSTGMWSTATLSQARWNLSATSVGNLAIFAGGIYSNAVDIFDNETNTWSTMTTIDLTQL